MKTILMKHEWGRKLSVAALAGVMSLALGPGAPAQDEPGLGLNDIEKYITDRLFDEGPFKAAWRVQRVRFADPGTYESLRQMQFKKIKDVGSERFRREFMERVEKNLQHWLSDRDMLISVSMQLAAFNRGSIDKVSEELDSGKQWHRRHFFNGAGIVSRIENEDSIVNVIEPDRGQLFFAARGVPSIWALEYLKKGFGKVRLERPEAGEVHWIAEDDEITRRLVFAGEERDLVKAEMRRDGELVQELSVIKGRWPFPEECLVHEYQPPGELYAVEKIYREKLERVGAGEIEALVVGDEDKIYDRTARSLVELSAEELRERLGE